jgi:hypothetical protein
VGDYALVGIFGALVGMGELISRYKDAPQLALARSPSAWGYCLINFLVSVAAYHLLSVFGIDFGRKDAALVWTRILVAGFGAMAFFRTSLFTVRIGTQDVGVGPVAFLQVILGATDRAVDRRRASGRASEINSFMEGLSFEKSLIALPTYCLALMQNLSDDDQKRLGQSVLALKQAEVADGVKLKILGVYLLNAVGPVALKSAITSLGDEIKMTDVS